MWDELAPCGKNLAFVECGFEAGGGCEYWILWVCERRIEQGRELGEAEERTRRCPLSTGWAMSCCTRRWLLPPLFSCAVRLWGRSLSLACWGL
jgi:hypothetical protein